MDCRQHIEIVQGRRSGKPCVIGTRIAVQDVLDYLAADRERRLSTTAL